MPKDVLGKEAQVGLSVAYGEASKGAKSLRLGTIVKVNPKTIDIVGREKPQPWERSRAGSDGLVEVTARRSDGAFIIICTN